MRFRQLKRDDILKLGVFLALGALGLTLWVSSQGTPLPGDEWLTVRIQELGQLHDNAGLINALPTWSWGVLFVATVLVVFGRKVMSGRTPETMKREALATFAAAVLLRFGNSLLKEIVQSPRPIADMDIHVDALSSGYGFPSGHVYGDVLVFGVLGVMAPAFLSKRLATLMRVIVVVVILLAGPARVVVGAHWPSDTIGGYLWGGAALCAAVWFGRWVSQRR